MACSIRTNHGKESPQSYFDKMKNKFKAWFFKKKAGSILYLLGNLWANICQE